MNRSSDPDALFPFLEDREAYSFAYTGEPKTHDCVRFCDAGVSMVTGVSPLQSVSETWSSKAGAVRVLNRLGGLEAAVDAVMSRVDISLAGRGDVALLNDRTLALVEGTTVVGPAADKGLRRQPRSAMVAAWTVRP